MGMVVELKGGERVLVGEGAIVNKENRRIRLYLEGALPVLREKDTMTAEEADTPLKRLYFALQNVYLAHNPSYYLEAYRAQANELAPHLGPALHKLNAMIANGETYKALREMQEMVAYVPKKGLPMDDGLCAAPAHLSGLRNAQTDPC
jgi:flagellar protein FlbT